MEISSRFGHKFISGCNNYHLTLFQRFLCAKHFSKRFININLIPLWSGYNFKLHLHRWKPSRTGGLSNLPPAAGLDTEQDRQSGSRGLVPNLVGKEETDFYPFFTLFLAGWLWLWRALLTALSGPGIKGLAPGRRISPRLHTSTFQLILWPEATRFRAQVKWFIQDF